MIQNIILILLIILLIFFASNDENFNKITSKKYIKYLFLILIIYFIYQNYNLYILIITIFIFIILNINFKEKFENINGIDLYQKYNNFKQFIYSRLELPLNEQFKNIGSRSHSYKEKSLHDYDIQPYLDEKLNEFNVLEKKSNEDSDLKRFSEPFKNEVVNIKDLFENIKNEIKKLT